MTLKEAMDQKAQFVKQAKWRDGSVLILTLLPNGLYGVWAKLWTPYNAFANPDTEEWNTPHEQELLLIENETATDWEITTDPRVKIENNA